MSIENTNSSELRTGAFDCLKLLKTLEDGAENLPEEANDAAVFFRLQEDAGVALAAGLGPMTPRVEGAIRALGEYIHMSIHAGTPCIDSGKWRPVVSRTAAERQSAIDELDAA